MAASQKEYSMLIKLGAELGRDFGGTFSSAQKSLSETQREVRSLQKTQADITAYQKHQKSIDSLKTELAEYERDMAALAEEIKATGGFSQDLANKELQLQLKMDNTAATIRQKSDAVHKMGVRLTEAGVDTASLAEEAKRLGAELADLQGKQEQATEEAKSFGEEGVSSALSVGDALAAAGIAKLLTEIYQAYGECVVGAAAFADEIGTVSVQYGIAAKDLQAYYYAAELVDVSVDTLTSTMAQNVRAMAQAKDGAAQYKEAYETLGVSITNADGSLRDSEKVYWDVIDALGQMENASERDALAMELVGESAQKINTLIAAGSGVMDEYTRMAEEAGYVMDEEVLAASIALDDELQIQKKNYEALKNTIGAQFAPEIAKALGLWNQMLAGATRFVEENPAVVKGLTTLGLGLTAVVGVYGGYVVITKAAAVAQTALNAAMSATPVGLAVTAVGVLTAGVIALTAAEQAELKASEQLTAASQEQQRELKALNEEYRAACEQYGEASYQAQELSWEIDKATAAFESSKQTIAEYRAEFEAVMQSHEEMQAAHAEMIREMELEEDSVFALIERLDELSGQTNLSAASQQEMLAIIRKLNEEVDGLGLSYDSITKRLSMTKEEIIALAEVDIAGRQYDEYYRMVTEQMAENTVWQSQYNSAIENEIAAKKELARIEAEIEKNNREAAEQGVFWLDENSYVLQAQQLRETIASEKERAASIQEELKKGNLQIEEYAQRMASLNGSTTKAAVSENLLAEATAAVARGYMTAEGAAAYYNTDLETLENRVEQVKAEQEAFASALKAVRAGFLAADEAARAYGLTVDGLDAYKKITELTEEINALSEAYTEAYEQAHDSIAGQYDVWDKAAEVIPADIAEINAALETQQAYWHDYNVDLESLQARAEGIEGLSDVIAAFADGSRDSVNTIAGLAQAGDEELRVFAENWKASQSMMQSPADSIAGFQVDSEELARLQTQLAAEIESLNLNTEAGAAAKATMDAYIRALKEGGDEAAEVARELAAQIGSALAGGETIPDSRSLPEGVFIHPQSRLRGYANGTRSAEAGLALVGEYGPELVAFGGGERVFTATETRRIVEAQSPRSGGQVIHLAPQFILQGVSDSNMADKLRECADILIDLVVERLEDMDMDARRSAYV